MESCAIALSSSVLNLRTLTRNLISPYYGLRRPHHEQQLPQPWPLQYSTPGHNLVTAAATRRSTSTLLPAAPPSLCSAFSKPIPIPLLLFTNKTIHDDDGGKVVVRASSFSSDSGPAESSINSEASSLSKPKKLGQTLQLAIMFGLWYLLNIYFNIFNKQVLKVFPYPTTVTAFQFGCGTLMILIMWAFNLHPKPKLRKSQVGPILLLAVAHTMGNLLTNISLGKVAVSFTHTIKAMEPFFTVIFSILFLAEWPTIWVVSSLVPIVGGVALASFTEASFNWIGFSSAMASNLTNQSRNVLSKKFMVRKEDTLDNINLFSIITIIAFILLIPFAIYMDGVKFSPSFLQSAASEGLNVKELCVRSLLAGFCFHSYQQVSYMILQMVSPVTHAVGNCVKRVVVIVSSVLFFRTPVSPINSLGTALALAGVFLYSRAKKIQPKPKVT